MLSGWLKKNTTLTVLKLGRETLTLRCNEQSNSG